MDSYELSPFVRRPLQERSRIALARIIAGASEVLVREGHDSFSMADIAEAAGLPVGNIYRRFKGKDSIVQAISLDTFTRLEAIIRDRLQGHRFASASEVVTELAAAMAVTSEQNEGLFRVLLSYQITSADLRGIVLAGRRRLVSIYKDALSGFLQDLPEPRRDLVIGVSYHLVAAAIVSKSRGDDPTLIDISWHDLAQEVAKAATAYLNEAR
jgi:AcrR family transcriptional regulator